MTLVSFTVLALEPWAVGLSGLGLKGQWRILVACGDISELALRLSEGDEESWPSGVYCVHFYVISTISLLCGLVRAVLA
jgi:hypothetical protein